MHKKHPLGFYSFAFVFLLALLSIGNFIERHESVNLFVAYLCAFIGYLFLLQEKSQFKALIGIGIVARIALFFAMPSLSDDIYRFIWDGTLLKNGIHPFEHLPGYYLDKNIPGITSELFQRLNSPEYFTIYPPTNQFLFWVSSLIGGENWLISANAIRLILLLSDIGSLYFLIKILDHYQKPRHLALWYFLNPLVIIEFVGNIHFESLVILGILAGIHWYNTHKSVASGIGIGLAAGIKLLPLIYLPSLFFRGLKTKKWWISILAFIVTVATLVPMFNSAFIEGMQSSLNLYFQKFEFNASIYFVAREIGYWVVGYNNIATIGPLLSVISVLSILTIAIIGWLKKWSLEKVFLFTLFSYLIFATTVHPWYILPLIAFGVLAGYYAPIAWSFLIFLTYIGYTSEGFNLPMTVVVIEYILLFTFIIVEQRLKIKSSKS